MKRALLLLGFFLSIFALAPASALALERLFAPGDVIILQVTDLVHSVFQEEVLFGTVDMVETGPDGSVVYRLESKKIIVSHVKFAEVDGNHYIALFNRDLDYRAWSSLYPVKKLARGSTEIYNQASTKPDFIGLATILNAPGVKTIGKFEVGSRVIDNRYSSQSKPQTIRAFTNAGEAIFMWEDYRGRDKKAYIQPLQFLRKLTVWERCRQLFR